jgi:lactoylglutathione lyase
MKRLDYVMVNVADMNRSIAFYRDLLGFEVKMESPGWTEFKTGDTVLALHGGGEPRTPSADDGKKAGVCTFGFNCEDVDKTCDALKAKGVRFVMEPTERPQEGIKLAVCLDPDGLAISFAQSLHAAAH